MARRGNVVRYAGHPNAEPRLNMAAVHPGHRDRLAALLTHGTACVYTPAFRIASEPAYRFRAESKIAPSDHRAAFLAMNYALWRCIVCLREAEKHDPIPAALARDIAAWDDQAMRLRSVLTISNMPLVWAVATRLEKPGTPPAEELAADGMVALVRAVDRYDVDGGRSFASFAWVAIRWEIIKALRRAGKISTHETGLDATCNPPVTDPVPDQDALDAILTAYGAALTDQERYVVRVRYDAATGPRRTLRRLGERLGMSGERVRQIEEVALHKLKAAIQG